MGAILHTAFTLKKQLCACWNSAFLCSVLAFYASSFSLGTLEVILIWGSRGFLWWFCVLAFFCHEVIQHLSWLLVTRHMKKSTDLRTWGTLKGAQHHKHPVCCLAHLPEQVVLIPSGNLGKQQCPVPTVVSAFLC